MSHITLPQPPQPTMPAPRPAVPKASAVDVRLGGTFKALDYTFLQRCLVVTPLLAIAFSLVLYARLGSVFAATSYVAGALFGCAMLGSLMLIVRRLSAAKTGQPYRGWDAAVPVWAIAGLKYVGFLIAAWGVASRGWAQPFAFVIGIALVQVVIVVRALGRKMVSRSIAEIYVDNAKR